MRRIAKLIKINGFLGRIQYLLVAEDTNPIFWQLSKLLSKICRSAIEPIDSEFVFSRTM